MQVWLHRISHEAEVSYALLKMGYLSIGFADFIDREFINSIRNKTLSESQKRDIFERENKAVWGELRRTRYNLWRFICCFKAGDTVVVPLNGGRFSIYKIEGEFVTADEAGLHDFTDESKNTVSVLGKCLKKGGKTVDLGFLIKVSPIAVEMPRSGYAESALSSRMKIRQTNANISDLNNEVNRSAAAFFKNRPLNFYADAAEGMKTGLLACLRSQLDDIKLERLIKWYFYKIGAAFVSIPAKNEGGKAENADADITAYFEALKLIIYVQAKHHTGETSQWAVRQISDYREQKENETDDNTYVSWVISTCDRFSPEAIKLARESNVRLINGLDFAEMLINAGLNENMNEALNG